MSVSPAFASPGAESLRRRKRGAQGVAVLALALALLIALHSVLPGSVGTLVATVLPWLGWLLPVLVVMAILTRRPRAWFVVLVPTLVWLIVVAPVLVPLGGSTSNVPAESLLTVASQNVEESANTAAESARTLAAEGADIIALVELDGDDRGAAAIELAESHPYSYTVGTVGLWSIYPIEKEKPLELGLGWRRALSADVITPNGLLSVYVIHAASFRPGDQENRDTMLRNLGELVPQDLSDKVIVLGDFNATTFDPALKPLLKTVSEPNQSTPSWGFTWPANFPLARIDHIFERGLTPVENRVFPAGKSDHHAILTVFRTD